MRRNGVTLIELVVALTIGSVLLAAAYAGMGTALDRREAALATVEDDLEAAATRASLRAWLEGARVVSESSVRAFSGIDGVYEGFDDDRISFLTSSMTPLGSGWTRVTLYVDRDPETVQRGLVADLTAWLGTKRTRVELAPDATGLEVRYRSDVLSGRPWHPSWISSTVMPAGIELRIEGPTEGELHSLLELTLTVAFEGGR